MGSDSTMRRNDGIPKRGDQFVCPTCGKRFVGFDAPGIGTVYLCPRCTGPGNFDEGIHQAHFEDLLDTEWRDNETGRPIVRYKVDDDRGLLLYTVADRDDPRSMLAVAALELCAQEWNEEKGTDYQLIDLDKSREELLTKGYIGIKGQIEEWRKRHLVETTMGRDRG